MMNQNPIVGGPGAAQPGGASSPGTRPSGEGGPAFRALLEKIEAHARDIKAASEDVADPKSLAGAVDAARASIEDALSLHDQLLETYRASQHQPPTPSED